jgi:para-nitrobenzyl esterase
MKRRTVLAGGLAAAAALGARAAFAASGPVANTRQGQVRGAVSDNGVKVFRGVPYGAPTGGANRFRAPKAPEPWSGVRDAIVYGDQCPQEAQGDPWVFAGWVRAAGESEDCLRLNVWTPGLDGHKRPVMVWLHGGGFSQYSATAPVYDGDRLARRGDVVVVTLNHRLNVFGYLYLSDLGGPNWAGAANAGQLDIIAALRWVRDNIEAFGGDPGNVTLFGESGGGGKICALMAMPAAQGLFQKAIVESGPLVTGVSRQVATEAAKAVLENLKLAPDQADLLPNFTSAQLVAAFAAVSAAGHGRAFGPVVDGFTLPRDPFEPDAPGAVAQIPLLIGTNRDEATILAGAPANFELDWDSLPVALSPLLVGADVDQLVDDYRKLRPQASAPDAFFEILTQLTMTIDTVRIAERKAAQGAAPVFVYQMDWRTPVAGGKLKAGHSVEVPFVFDNAVKGGSLVGTGKDAQVMADQMSSAWLAFARTGNPANKLNSVWPAYSAADRSTLIFDVKSQLAVDPQGDVRALLKDVQPMRMAR